MPDIVKFEPVKLTIVEIGNGLSTNELDASEIYSEWKDWVKIGDNAKHPQAFRFEGGSPISPQRSLGVSYFLMNGWKIRPAESNHKLSINGNLFIDGGVGSIFIPTIGNFVVNVETQVSSLFDIAIPTTALSNNDLTNIAQSVWDKSRETFPANSMGKLVLDLVDSNLGSWRIEGSQMKMYPPNSSTSIATFNLVDKNGDLTLDIAKNPPFERNRV